LYYNLQAISIEKMKVGVDAFTNVLRGGSPVLPVFHQERAEFRRRVQRYFSDKPVLTAIDILDPYEDDEIITAFENSCTVIHSRKNPPSYTYNYDGSSEGLFDIIPKICASTIVIPAKVQIITGILVFWISFQQFNIGGFDELVIEFNNIPAVLINNLQTGTNTLILSNDRLIYLLQKKSYMNTQKIFSHNVIAVLAIFALFTLFYYFFM
jgi:hypothetical protein